MEVTIVLQHPDHEQEIVCHSKADVDSAIRQAREKGLRYYRRNGHHKSGPLPRIVVLLSQPLKRGGNTRFVVHNQQQIDNLTAKARNAGITFRIESGNGKKASRNVRRPLTPVPR